MASDQGHLAPTLGFSCNAPTKPFLLLFDRFGEQSTVLKLLRFIPVRCLKFSTCRTGSALPGGPVLQYCSTAIDRVVRCLCLAKIKKVPYPYIMFGKTRSMFGKTTFLLKYVQILDQYTQEIADNDSTGQPESITPEFLSRWQTKVKISPPKVAKTVSSLVLSFL